MRQNLPPDVTFASVTACLLAGGEGMRLGGKNKGLQRTAVNDKPLVAIVIERLKAQADELLISANADLEQYARWRYPVITDSPELVDAGPLAGVVAAGERASTDWLLVAAVDCPQLPLNLVERLMATGQTIAVPHDGTRLQPLAMLLSRKLVPDIRQYLLGGQRSVFGWLERHDYATVDFSDQPEAFINLNTADDFSRYDHAKK